MNEKFQVGLNARNLLNEEQVQTTDYSGQVLRINEKYAQVALTLRARW